MNNLLETPKLTNIHRNESITIEIDPRNKGAHVTKKQSNLKPINEGNVYLESDPRMFVRSFVRVCESLLARKIILLAEIFLYHTVLLLSSITS